MKNLLNPKWVLLINTLPIILLSFIVFGDYSIIKSLLKPEHLKLWSAFGFTLLGLAIITLGYAIFSIINKKQLSIHYAFICLAVYITYLYIYSINSHDILPWDIPRWMLSGDILLYVGTFIMPTLVHALLIIVLKLTPEHKTHKAWKNILFAIAIPLVWFIFFQLIMPFWRVVGSGFSYHLMVVLMVIGVILFLFFLIRSLYILISKKGKSWKKYELFWKIPITLLFPIAGLLVNNNYMGNGVFGDFSSFWFYTITIINGILICLPQPKHKLLELLLHVARCITFAFTFYFFIVFLPFLPLSILAILAFGLGFLMLAPILLFVLHTQELVISYSRLKQQFSKRFLVIISIVGFLVLPIGLSISYQIDRMTLHNALDFVYSPDYSKTYKIDKGSLEKTLQIVDKNKQRRNSDPIFSGQTPYLSSFFNWLVLDNLTISDAKLNTMNRIFFNAESFPSRSENIRNKNVYISDIKTDSQFNNIDKNWTTWVDFEITNANENNFFSEYATTIDLPNGCWINDYYLYVGDKKEMGILAEKKSAMWVFSQIRGTNRDPGLLHYLTGNRVSFRVFPFAENEVRKTGIQFTHKEPLHINIDNHQIQLGEPNNNTIDYSYQTEHLAYISTVEKQTLPKINRKPYFHFIIDTSEEKDSLTSVYNITIKDFLDKNKNIPASKITFVNTYSNTKDFDNNWQNTLKAQRFEGGFYLERAIKKIYFETYKKPTSTYPIIVVVTEDMLSSVVQKDFKDFKMAFPESNLFYHLNTLGYLASHDLTQHPKQKVTENATIAINHSVLAWPNTKNSLAYLPNNTQPEVVLKSNTFQINSDDIKPKNWTSGLLLQAKHISHTLHPNYGENEWLDQVKYSFMSQIMTPQTSYIVVENEAQKAILKKKQKAVLEGKKALDINEQTQQMSEPRLLIIVLLFGIFILLRRQKLKHSRVKIT